MYDFYSDNSLFYIGPNTPSWWHRTVRTTICIRYKGGNWLLPPPSVSSGTSVWQSLSFSICRWHQHSSAVAAQQLRLQLAGTTGYTQPHAYIFITSLFIQLFSYCLYLKKDLGLFKKKSVCGRSYSLPLSVYLYISYKVDRFSKSFSIWVVVAFASFAGPCLLAFTRQLASLAN